MITEVHKTEGDHKHKLSFITGFFTYQIPSITFSTSDLPRPRVSVLQVARVDVLVESFLGLVTKSFTPGFRGPCRTLKKSPLSSGFTENIIMILQ